MKIHAPNTDRLFQIGAVLLGAIVLATSVALKSRLDAFSDPRVSTHSAAADAPGRNSISRWLWPGAFEVSPSTSGDEANFVASGRRYVVQARSNELLIRHGSNPELAIDISFVGAVRGIAANLQERVPGTFTLFTGVAGRAAATPWQRYSNATFPGIYPGIDARLRANGGDLELDFLLAAGADPKAILLSGENSTRFAIDAPTGDILVSRRDERFRMHRPRAFQPRAVRPVEIEVQAITDGRSLRFELPRFDHTRPVVIDPLVATWSTFLGTNTDAMYDNSAAVATDSAGNLYVGGLTELSTEEQPADSFPTTPGNLNPPNSRSPGDNCAAQCGYVLKLSPTHQVIYGALIYGLTVNALAVDAAGSAYITGTTLDSTNFPGTPGVFDNDPGGQAFVSKISADGSQFVYSALFTADSGNGVAVDAQGNAYVVGQVSVPDLPTTPGSIKPSNPIGTVINQDGFLLKINPSGSAIVYGTYLGGGGTDVANAVQVDSQGDAIVVGQTASSDFVGMTALVSGPSDAFMIRVSPDGSQILTGQTFGGSGDDYANGVTPDGNGGWITCGATTSTDLPTSSGAFQSVMLGQRNGWVRRVDSGFTTIYSTYFGGSTIDGCLNVASDSSGDAYLVGVTFSADLPTTAGAFQEDSSAVTDFYFSGLSDQFYVTSLEPDREAYFAELSGNGGSLLYGTYLGGYMTVPRNFPPLTIGEGIAISPSGTVYVSGATEAASFPVTDGGLRTEIGGQQDGFIVSFGPSAIGITTPSLLPAAPLQVPYSVALAASGGTPPYTWSQVGFELPDGISLSPAGVLSGTAANPQTETSGYQFTVKATDSRSNIAYKSFFLNVTSPGAFNCSGNTCTGTLTEGSQIAYQLPALARGVQPETFTVTGQLPTGITVSNTGAITGRATQSGVYQATFNIADAAGHAVALDWDVVVGTGTTPNVALTASPASVTIGQTVTLNWNSYYTSGCTVSGGGADGTNWSGTVPVDGSTTISATTAGSFVYTISCADGGASMIKSQATVTVTGSSGSGRGSTGKSAGGGAFAGLELALLAALVGWRGARFGVAEGAGHSVRRNHGMKRLVLR